MKRVIALAREWTVVPCEPKERLAPADLELLAAGAFADRTYPAEMPAQVHQILLANGVIEDPAVWDNASKCTWVSEKDWIYVTSFKGVVGDKVSLLFKGLDTIVDVYFNGEHLSHADDMFVPLELDITRRLKERNLLVLHFHSPWDHVRKLELPPEWAHRIRKQYLVRKCVHDFDDYLGAIPYLTPIGVFAAVELHVQDSLEITASDVTYRFVRDFDSVHVTVALEGIDFVGAADKAAHVVLLDPSGNAVLDQTFPITGSRGDWVASTSVALERPELWWPKRFGDQKLYVLRIEVLAGGQVRDGLSRNLGFRKVVMVKDFDFRVNGVRVRLWGGNFTPVSGISHCWDRERTLRLLDMVDVCEMNALRVWGEGEPLDEEFYDECDRRGILLWQEFYGWYGDNPDLSESRARHRVEAEHLVTKLKSHPSIIMWCGGNESYMGYDYARLYQQPYAVFVGSDIFERDYREVCARLDPGRYYHINSPSGGSFANDPASGDTHGYTHMWYVPGCDYPIMLSENTRTSAPNIKSLKRFIGEERLWPKEFSGKQCRSGDPPMPATWLARSTGNLRPRLSPIEMFYDADSPESLVYRFGAAHGLHLRRTVERSRRGKPAFRAADDVICMGHFVWKLNDTWTNIFCSIIDYYLEPYIPYYELKRANAPILLSFDIGDHIYLWGVNDTPRPVTGCLRFKLYNLERNEFIKVIEKKIVLDSNQSAILLNLDCLGQFRRNNVLFAELLDDDGRLLARSNDFVDIERHLSFPQARLSLEMQNELVTVRSDTFARCVELTGNDDGDEFGWLFDDNYFDLLPGESKRIAIKGSHTRGMVRATPRYCTAVAEVRYTA